MSRKLRLMSSLVSLLAAASLWSGPSLAKASPPLAIADLLRGTAGQWTGELQYRDYQTNTWQGLPMKVGVAVQPDQVTLIRTASFEDGPKAGIVWITTITQFDPASGVQSYAMLRKGRELDYGTAKLAMPRPPRDALHWTMVTTEQRRDGDSLAEVRETTTRDGAVLTTLKEVNPLDDGKDEWLPRNRTVLKLNHRVR